MEDHDQCLRQAAWQMRFGKPDRPYLSFVERYLVRQAPGQLRDDPFDPEALIHTDFYYPRDDVESRIESPDHQVILGPRGAGKTFLFSVLSSRWRKHTLIVPWPHTPKLVPGLELDASVAKARGRWTTPVRVSLYNAMCSSFSGEEIKTVCVDLEIEYDDLPGEGKSAKVRELINHCRRRHITPEKVVAACKQANPNFLQDASSATHSTADPQPADPLNTESLAESLAESIVASYWRQTYFDRFAREPDIAPLMDHPQWFLTLWQFCKRLTNPFADRSEKVESRERSDDAGSGEGDSGQTEPSVMLDELIRFVIGKGDRPSQYETIRLLIDGTERLTAPELTLLIHDLSGLCAKHPALRVKLFADPSRQNEIEEWAAPSGRSAIGVYHLPEWSVDDLKHLLALRLLAHTPGEWDEPDLGRLLMEASVLKLADYSQFLNILAEGARKTYDQRHGLDAPIHALRLARGVIAECACRKAHKKAAVTETDLRSLVALYWSMAGER